ncbi:adenine deaminase [candidate division KSB1 bacterium]
MKTISISGKIIDVVQERIFEGSLIIGNGKIIKITEEKTSSLNYILPGLIDAHVHIESSMLVPSEFAKLAVIHGTVATVSDPHEIANVLGVEGIHFMIENGKKVPFKFYFGASSCVPATPFETSGAELGIAELEKLLQMDEIKYMAEMMNFPAVLKKDPIVMDKINLAKKYGKIIDGHAPGLTGKDAAAYVHAGISTDHECFTIEEALDKIHAGMKILIREGSAAKNFETLIPLIDQYPDRIMLCSDDKHPNDLQKGHINLLVKRAINKGYNPIKVIKSCTYNPVNHYKLDTGLLQEGDHADLIVIDQLNEFNVLETYIQGEKVAEKGQSKLKTPKVQAINIFNATKITEKNIQIKAKEKNIQVIKALEGQLITEKIIIKPKVNKGLIVSDVLRDILKLIVMNRYKSSSPVVGFINNFGIQYGAIASTVAHDSHNIIAIGVKDEDIVKAVNLLIDSKGGIVVVHEQESLILPLPVAGIMSEKDGYTVASMYEKLDMEVKKIGSKLQAPFMTLSFMALLVIPELKLSDKGLFDGNNFTFTSIFEK